MRCGWPQIALAAVGLLLSACAAQPMVPPLGARVSLPALRDGDVMLSGSVGWRSWVVRHFDTWHTPYTHAGLILIQDGEPVLLHSSPAESARVASMPLAEYLASPILRNVAIYRSDDPSIAAAAAQQARRYLERAVPFDAEYDIDSDATLYCTEMIWRSYLSAGVDLLGTPRRQLRAAPVFGPLIWPSDFTQMPPLVMVFSTVGTAGTKSP